MVENIIIYTVELIKYYLIMKNLLGFKMRKNIVLNMVGMLLIVLFSLYVTISDDNPIIAFQIYVIIEMFIMIKERILKLVLSTCWLTFIVGMLDGMFLVALEFFTYRKEISYSMLECISALMTTILFAFLVIIIRFKTKGSTYSISKIYYIYLSVLTMAEAVLITVMKSVVAERYGVNALVMIIICTIVMVINIVVVVCLAVSNDGYKQRDELNKKYLKVQEEYYTYLKKKNEDIRSFRHDIKGHMIAIREFSEQGDMTKIQEYIDKIVVNAHFKDKNITVENSLVDAILNQIVYEAEKYDISIKVEGRLFEKCGVEPYDLCVIFANLLDNAIEGSKSSEKI